MVPSDRALDIYLVAIGGTGMAPLACLLKALGHHVRGSDGPLYPPMSTVLETAGIEPIEGFDAANLSPQPDLVVIGNAVPRTHVEALAVEAMDVERISMPQALARFCLAERSPLVVCGTHGKTTTTSMAAFVYEFCEQDPGYLIGGLPLDLESSFKLGTGARFVVEGDEYNAAYFDRGPKFLHYLSHTAILTSAEYDHADLYESHDTLKDRFRELASSLPKEGVLIACGDGEFVREVEGGTTQAPRTCRLVRYGLSPNDAGLDVRVGELDPRADGTHFVVEDRLHGDWLKTEVTLGMWGEHNVSNALAVFAAARLDGLDPRRVAEAFSRFRGVRRRLEERGRPGGIVVVDDFAHHPSAVSASLGGLRSRYPDRKVLVLYEPRSLTAGRSFQFEAYVEAFSGADAVGFAPVFHAGRLEDEERLDRQALCEALAKRGVVAFSADSTAEILEHAREILGPEWLVATMSSGSFDGLPAQLLTELD